MEKIFWEILAASALVITMEQFFSAFLKKKIVGWKYTGMWIFFFLYHMSIMGLVKGPLATMTGNVIALAIICWCSYQTTFAINIMMILLAISLSGISEGVIAIFILLVQGDLTGNLYLYSVMGKIVFLDLHSDFVPAMQRKGGRSTKERIRHFSDHNCKCKHLGTDRKSYNINPCRRRSGKNLVRNYYIHVIVG